MAEKFFLMVFLAIYVLQVLGDLWLERLNGRSIEKSLGEVPSEFKGHINEERMSQIARYTLAKSRLGIAEDAVLQPLFLFLILGGPLWDLESLLVRWDFHAVTSGVLFFLVPGGLLHAAGLPFNFFHTFVLEQKYGFNQSTIKLWVTDQIKAALVSAALVSFILAMIFWIIMVSPDCWWWWAFVAVSLVQIVLIELYPVLIAPLFNKFEPIDDQRLAKSITILMEKNGITVRRILQMNAGLRSLHTNAYFTGLGRSKQIVLFDTLLQSHPHEEILAILAHEVGHYKENHMVKQILAFEVLLFAGFLLARVIMNSETLYTAFGFSSSKPYIGLFLAGVFLQKLGYFIRPLYMALSRHFELRADLFAARFINSTEPLLAALRRLGADNLANLTPHPLYVAFHYSHPTLTERIRTLHKANPAIFRQGCGRRSGGEAAPC